MINILKESFHFFSANIIPIALLTLWIEVPFMLIINIDLLGQTSEAVKSSISIVEFCVLFLVTPFSIGAHTELYHQIINGQPFQPKRCFSISFNFFLPVVYASVFYFLFLIVGIGFFIIPGIFIGSRLCFFPFLIIFENVSPVQALKKSFSITEKYFWDIALPLTLVNVVIFFPWLKISTYLKTPGIENYAILIIAEFFFAVLGWINIIVPFRVYSKYRMENQGLDSM